MDTNLRFAPAPVATLPLLAISLLLSARVTLADVSEPAPRPVARWEFLTSSGAVVATGSHHDALSHGPLSTVQAAYVTDSPLAFTGTLGWARNRERLSGAGRKLDLFSYDLGVETRVLPFRVAGRLAVAPFAAAGTGARTYRQRDGGPGAAHALTAYAGAGAELGGGRLRLRLEARDYLLDSEPLANEGRDRFVNEVALLAGLRLVSR